MHGCDGLCASSSPSRATAAAAATLQDPRWLLGLLGRRAGREAPSARDVHWPFTVRPRAYQPKPPAQGSAVHAFGYEQGCSASCLTCAYQV